MSRMALVAMAGPRLVGVATYSDSEDGKSGEEVVFVSEMADRDGSRWIPRDGFVELFVPADEMEGLTVPVSVLRSVEGEDRLLLDVAVSLRRARASEASRKELAPVRGHASRREWELVATVYGFSGPGRGRTRFAILQSDDPRSTCVVPVDGPSGSRALLRNPIGWRHTGDIWGFGFRRVYCVWTTEGAMSISANRPEGVILAEYFSTFASDVPDTQRFEVHTHVNGSGRCLVTARSSEREARPVLGDQWVPLFSFYAYITPRTGTRPITLYQIRERPPLAEKPLPADHTEAAAVAAEDEEASTIKGDGYAVFLKGVPSARRWRILNRLYVF